jgi:hypothetical protein
MKREQKTCFAEAKDYADNPADFVKEVRILWENFSRHGRRTNKEILGKDRGVGHGVPVALLINPTQIEDEKASMRLERGTDRDDHFILKEKVFPEKIIGVVDLDGKDYIDAVKLFLEKIEESFKRERVDME